jgi:hypothetical protein
MKWEDILAWIAIVLAVGGILGWLITTFKFRD